eukprot:gene7495-641_t
MQSRLTNQRVAGARPMVAAQRPRLTAVAPSPRSVKAHAALPRWEDMFRYLSERGTVSVNPVEAQELIANGSYVLIDVRPEPIFEKAHIEGSINVPIYKKLSPINSGPTGFLKFIAFSLNGVTPIELNENFMEQLKEASKGDKGVIVACEAGGTLRPSTNFSMGKASRALKEGGMVNAKHLDRGLYGWYQADLPFNGDYRPEMGRTPNAAQDPTLKVAAAAGGYQIRPEDKKNQPK